MIISRTEAERLRFGRGHAPGKARFGLDTIGPCLLSAFSAVVVKPLIGSIRPDIRADADGVFSLAGCPADLGAGIDLGFTAPGARDGCE